MSWYFRAIERDDGHWTCQHGLRQYDAHPALDAALAHLREIADEMGQTAEFFVHFLDGRVQRVVP